MKTCKDCNYYVPEIADVTGRVGFCANSREGFGDPDMHKYKDACAPACWGFLRKRKGVFPKRI